MNTSSSKYIQVIENIHKELMTSERSDNIRLHAGVSGVALFRDYYNRIVHRKKYLKSKNQDI